MRFRSRPSAEGGNVLFLILIAVALFAALSYAVTSSTRNSGNGIGDEQMQLALNEMQSQVVAARSAIMRMVLSGISIDQIDTSWDVYYTDTNSDCLSSACHLYDTAGGGLSWYHFAQLHPTLSPVPELPIWPDVPQQITWTWVANKGTAWPDMIYTYRVTASFCDFINKKLGISGNIAGSPVTIGFLYDIRNYAAARGALGPQTSSDVGLGDTWQAPYLAGRDEGCFMDNSGWYFFYSMLYPT